MENKYYTPRLEEFYIGFNCEFNNHMQSKIFEETVCDVDLLSIIMDSYEHEDYKGEFSDTFRVRYLNQKDIKEIGFNQLNKNIWIGYTDFLLDKINPEYGFYLHSTIHFPIKQFRDSDKLELKFLKIYVHRYFEESMDIYKSDESILVFEGLIKNKSELKKVLIQLGIINEQ